MPCTKESILEHRLFVHDETQRQYKVITTFQALKTAGSDVSWRYGSYVVYTASPVVDDYGINYATDFQRFTEKFTLVPFTEESVLPEDWATRQEKIEQHTKDKDNPSFG